MKTRYKYKKLSFLSVTEFEGMRCLGTDDYCCTESDPCKEGEGDCDSDSDCASDLVCGKNNCKQFSDKFGANDDCCVPPEGSDLEVVCSKCPQQDQQQEESQKQNLQQRPSYYPTGITS